MAYDIKLSDMIPSIDLQLKVDAFLTRINEYSPLRDINMNKGSYLKDININICSYLKDIKLNICSYLKDININIYDNEVQLFILLISLIMIIILILCYGVTLGQYIEMIRHKREAFRDKSVDSNNEKDLLYYKLCYQYAYNNVMCASKPQSRIPLYSRLWEKGARLNTSDIWRIYRALRYNPALANKGYTLPNRQLKDLNGYAAYSSPELLLTLYASERLGITR